MEGFRERQLFSFDKPVDEVKPKRKSRKHKRRSSIKISKKEIGKVEKSVENAYKKYLNDIDKKPSCKKESFAVFAKKHYKNKTRGKKNKRKTAKKSAVDASEVEEPSVAAEETPVESPATEETPVEAPTVEETPVEAPTVEAPTVEETPVESPAVEETPVEAPSVAEAPTAEGSAAEGEQKPEEGGIIKSVTDALGLSPKEEEPKKEGGKRKNRSRKSRGRGRGRGRK